MKLAHYMLLVVLLLVTTYCGPKPQPDNPPFPDDPVPVEPEDPTKEYSCETACNHLRGDDGSGLECEEGEPTPAGASCETVCKNTIGTPTEMPVECMSRVKDCAETEACSR